MRRYQSRGIARWPSGRGHESWQSYRWAAAVNGNGNGCRDLCASDRRPGQGLTHPHAIRHTIGTLHARNKVILCWAESIDG